MASIEILISALAFLAGAVAFYNLPDAVNKVIIIAASIIIVTMLIVLLLNTIRCRNIDIKSAEDDKMSATTVITIICGAATILLYLGIIVVTLFNKDGPPPESSSEASIVVSASDVHQIPASNVASALEPDPSQVTKPSQTQTTTSTLSPTNPWLQAEVRSAPTNDGTRAYILINTVDVESLPDEDYMEFCDIRVTEARKEGFKYFTVYYQDGTGLVFPGCLTEVADFGELNDDGKIETWYGSLVYRNGILTTEAPKPSPTPTPTPTPSLSPSPSPSPTPAQTSIPSPEVTVKSDSGKVIAPNSKVERLLDAVDFPEYNVGDVLEFCYDQKNEPNYISSVITYNEDNQKKYVTGYHANLKADKYGEIFYDSEGCIIGEDLYYDSAQTRIYESVEYIYDRDGILEEYRSYDENGTFDNSKSYKRVEYTLTNSGDLATIKMEREDGDRYYVSEYKDGKIIKETRYNSDGTIRYSLAKTYYNDGREKDITYYDSVGNYSYAICYLQTSE